MTKEFIMSHIDHTLLRPTASWKDIQKLCEEAIKYKTASVCVPACYIKRIKDRYQNSLNICTVIGFPLGYNSTKSKISEASSAISDGASEIDMVINITDVKNHDFERVLEEIHQIRKVTEGKILKVIIETCYLTQEEKIKLCEIITQTDADYIKTSTGFGNGGASLEDILLFKKHIGPNVKIKAAGGVRSIEEIEIFLVNGCDRIGTSSAVALLEK